MDQAGPSVTALATSMMRAVHTRLDRPLLIDDPWGDRLVGDDERAQLLEAVRAGLEPGQRERIGASASPGEALDAVLRAQPLYGTVVVRTRYAEDALEAAVAAGVRQYVIVGAGMDSFALRRPAFARDVDVFEVDHPATQEDKLERLRALGLSSAPEVYLIATDLSRESLDSALARSPFRPDVPAFFSWLGVTTYLTREANLATLRAIAACAGRGSELVFTYIDQGELDSDREAGYIQRVRATLATTSEPWVSGFHPAQLEADLRDVGLALVEDLGGEELGARYCQGRDDGLFPAGAVHIAHARVGG
jgi:methyltransferase (TIGR00027 family)